MLPKLTPSSQITKTEHNRTMKNEDKGTNQDNTQAAESDSVQRLVSLNYSEEIRRKGSMLSAAERIYKDESIREKLREITVFSIECNNCGYDGCNVPAEYSRQTANANYWYCPECGGETSSVMVDDPS